MPPMDPTVAASLQALGAEFAIRGDELLKLSPVVATMAKKGKSFKSGWVEYYVCLHNNLLYYYREMRELPSGVLSLDGCSVESVDIIYKNKSANESHILAEECGPCFKVTSRLQRSLLFRARSNDVRIDWIRRLQQASYDHVRASLEQARCQVRDLLQQVHDNELQIAAQRKQLEMLQQTAVAVEMFADPEPPLFPTMHRLRAAPSTSDGIDTAALTKATSELAELTRNLQQSLSMKMHTTHETGASDDMVQKKNPRSVLNALEKVMADMLEVSDDDIRRHKSRPTLESLRSTQAVPTPIMLLEHSPSSFQSRYGTKPEPDHTEDSGWSTPKPTGGMRDYRLSEDDEMRLSKTSMLSSFHKAGDELTSLLVRPDMIVVTSLLTTCQRSDKMALLLPLLRVYGSRHALYKLMQWSIDTEVHSALSLQTLFRSDDYSSRLLSMYSKSVGLRFIHTALSEHIRALCTDKHIEDYELNIAKDPSLADPLKLQINAQNLMDACQTIVDAIYNHMDQLPLSFAHVCRYLKEKLIERFLDKNEAENDGNSSAVKAIMGGFLFLRFICPAITTPHAYGLVPEVPNANSRRILVLVTKLLFNSSTEVEFGVKEPYMRVVNSFIVKNAPRMAFLYTRLTTAREGDVEACFDADSDGIFTNINPDQLGQDRQDITLTLRKHVDEVVAKVALSSEPLAAKLRTLMEPSDDDDDLDVIGSIAHEADDDEDEIVPSNSILKDPSDRSSRSMMSFFRRGFANHRD
ncbi:hypothetical protein SPRG_20260 [Saprolegnia parasitica CBS 223.65]|uniref:Ras-GAP domain-containing protein n=1 Tax=Saprolegnia parasitica (strain CBS 223.65) TaxID=695850 RepID=A0A067CNI5_SAPPC|nr:hypothetical protein SPRG_20260 [Saprolegnia parasitica CBS 223.65]KDO28101.1 hypothetical protein SPRG_20260 [Saprolegnia parasitica CBS 223.65]|eukprot:XP_012201243.1 hypothetical protein SPRG_20260 [Saprolegnia parasitica CBS 223.65]